jgi:hypothetical protein
VESGGVEAAAFTCDTRILKVGYIIVTIREYASASAPGQAPPDRAADIVFG